MVRTIFNKQTEQEMLFLSTPEKRERIIEAAIFLQLKEDPQWFSEVAKSINNGISANPNKRAEVVLQWIMSCEKLHTSIVKEEIQRVYDQRTT